MVRSEIFISTDSVEHSLRDEYWREVTRPFCETTPASTNDAATLEGTMRIRHRGAMTLGSTTFNAQHYRRDKATIARSGLDHYLVHVLVSGSIHGQFGERHTVAAPGDICIIDLARPYECNVDAGERLAMTVPRAGIDNLLGARDLHGYVLQVRHPMTRLLVDYLCGIHAVSDQLSASEDIAVQDALTTLLSAGLANTTPIQDEPKSVLSQALRARAIAYIDRHLADPYLGPELLGQRFRVSRAHLYRVFADLGGVANVIKSRRLDAAYARMAAVQSATRSVAQVAAECGFQDMRRFRKAFIARFDVAPEEAGEWGRRASSPIFSGNPLSHHFATHGNAPRVA